jgi:hypothetical protein
VFPTLLVERAAMSRAASSRSSRSRSRACRALHPSTRHAPTISPVVRGIMMAPIRLTMYSERSDPTGNVRPHRGQWPSALSVAFSPAYMSASTNECSGNLATTSAARSRAVTGPAPERAWIARRRPLRRSRGRRRPRC